VDGDQGDQGDGQGNRGGQGDDGAGADRAGSTTRPATRGRAHPPKTKVDLNPAESPAAAGSAAKSPPKKTATRARTKRPIYRRGWFWVAVIVVEVIGALIISVVASRPPDLDDLSGGDLAAFCTQVKQVHTQAAPPSVDLTTVSKEFQAQADTYRQLEGVAPTNLRPDLATLAALTDELVATSNDIAQHKAADPTFAGGIAQLDAKQADVVARSTEASNHVDTVVLHACGIDLTAVTTTTGAGPPTTPR
jgi:hypothetical protein